MAIKVLAEEFAADADRIARFEREAKVLASLNHPNIAAIHGIEESEVMGAVFPGPSSVEGSRVVPALVMELVEGTTLADRLASGPMPIDELIRVGRQIAEALEAAHEKAIIHRDLKPGNVMLTADGGVKVLDLGLAAVAESGGTQPADATHSPTLSMAATRAGVILGTAAYMSPEQAVGKPVDKRSDIWSFGVVLWEMLTGTRLFDGETVSHTLADVLRAPIDFDNVPATAVGKWQISTAGGDKPRWRRDGTELYYIALDGKLMTVPVKLGNTFEVGVAAPLFDTRVVGFYPYDVTADGRFLMLTPAEAGADTSSPVTVILNWQAGRR